jgi:hypothetical protein
MTISLSLLYKFLDSVKKLRTIIQQKDNNNWEFSDGPFISHNYIVTSLSTLKSYQYQIIYKNGEIDLEPFNIKIKDGKIY